MNPLDIEFFTSKDDLKDFLDAIKSVTKSAKNWLLGLGFYE